MRNTNLSANLTKLQLHLKEFVENNNEQGIKTDVETAVEYLRSSVEEIADEEPEQFAELALLCITICVSMGPTRIQSFYGHK
jgi:hypothetical protein